MTQVHSLLIASALVISFGNFSMAASTPSAAPGAKVIKLFKPKVSGFKSTAPAKHPPSCTAGSNGDSTCITYKCDADGVCVEDGTYCVSGTTGKRIPC